MMKSTYKLHHTIFILVTALVLISCSLLSGAPDPTSAPASVPDVEDETGAESSGSTLVTSLAEVKSAVIQIEAQGTFVDPDFGEYSGAGRGSGFIIDPSGLALTNNHVVTGAALLTVWVGGDNSRSYNAKILAVSECSDLALIDIDGDNFPYMEWYQGSITVGLEVYAAGFPLGDPEFTLTKGIVSKEKADGESNWASVNQVIEHDATINPGHSGGPLVSEDGQVVGVNYASYAAAGQFFAIGRDTTLPIINQLKAGNDVDSLGINGVALLTDDGTLSGIWVSSVKSGSAADGAGVEPGDFITSLEGLPLATDGSMSTYCDIIRTQGDENTLGMEVMRFQTNETLEGQFNGRMLSVTGTLADSSYDTTSEDPSQGDPAGYGSEYILEIYDDGYMAITDDYNALYVEVPDTWNQINGTLWTEYWGDLYFEAANVLAAPNLDDFLDIFGASGIDYAASKDWGAIGGYVQLLDATKYWFEDDCDYEWREDYEDPVYEGAYDYWDCGQDARFVLIGARPISDPTAYLVLVQVQVLTDFDFDALERIMDTFDVDYGYLP
jgi:serine protease Do